MNFVVLLLLGSAARGRVRLALLLLLLGLLRVDDVVLVEALQFVLNDVRSSADVSAILRSLELL